MTRPDPSAAITDDAILALVSAGQLEAATAATLRRYGSELLGFLYALAANPSDADDAWALLGAKIWRGLPQFAGRSSLRTWLYVLARRSLSRVTRRQHGAMVPLSQASEVGRLAAEIRQTSLPHLAPVRDRFAELRAALDPDDQELLVLRVDRELPWRDIAAIIAEPEQDLDTVAAAARKRFERVKARVRALASAAGLLDRND